LYPGVFKLLVFFIREVFLELSGGVFFGGVFFCFWCFWLLSGAVLYFSVPV